MLSHDGRRRPGPTYRPSAHQPGGPTGVGLWALQRSVGNRAVASLLSVQRVKLSTGQDTDDLTAEQLTQLYARAIGAGKGGSQAKAFRALKSGLGKKHPKAVKLKKPVKLAALTKEDVRKIQKALRRFAQDEEFITEASDDVMDLVNDAVGGLADFQGSEGGFGEHAFAADSTYFDKPPNLRPGKSSSLFTSIYVKNAVPANAQIAPNLSSLACQEPGCTLGGTVYFTATKPYREYDQGTGQVLAKAPPICHKTPYAVMVKALLQVVTETTWKSAIQPGDAGWDDMHYELAWGIATNLGPGHAACNSRTASQGKRQPTATEVNTVRAWARQNNYVS